uniref:Uncharacterized protein n=1 Tax=Chromera velia CCMP2878 TaxID=1169474 RepID=A0A0G4HQ08_9ALVE|eukprot:Cvel_30037.t1-p1 / transcript=Cvel_30037.t1 / gene=Cvel_30037 / organism=Chromera_velia_CCMP2878 / gene_product=hypothetical protein / transcript_product=hypothetical protein / location=Cvel_scaffold4221:4038-8020(-) / protein_length=468 / sequence_SO=supercontig / SO=protein_coding / is_pseudo=false
MHLYKRQKSRLPPEATPVKKKGPARGGPVKAYANPEDFQERQRRGSVVTIEKMAAMFAAQQPDKAPLCLGGGPGKLQRKATRNLTADAVPSTFDAERDLLSGHDRRCFSLLLPPVGVDSPAQSHQLGAIVEEGDGPAAGCMSAPVSARGPIVSETFEEKKNKWLMKMRAMTKAFQDDTESLQKSREPTDQQQEGGKDSTRSSQQFSSHDLTLTQGPEEFPDEEEDKEEEREKENRGAKKGGNSASLDPIERGSSLQAALSGIGVEAERRKSRKGSAMTMEKAAQRLEQQAALRDRQHSGLNASNNDCFLPEIVGISMPLSQRRPSQDSAAQRSPLCSRRPSGAGRKLSGAGPVKAVHRPPTFADRLSGGHSSTEETGDAEKDEEEKNACALFMKTQGLSLLKKRGGKAIASSPLSPGATPPLSPSCSFRPGQGGGRRGGSRHSTLETAASAPGGSRRGSGVVLPPLRA